MERLTKYSEINKDYITPHCDNFNCNGCCIDCDYKQVIINKLAEYENTGLEPKEVEQLKHELEELKKNAIVPKFKIYSTIFVIVGTEIEEYFVDEIVINSDDGIIRYRDKYENTILTEQNWMFSTEQQAEEALRKLEGK